VAGSRPRSQSTPSDSARSWISGTRSALERTEDVRVHGVEPVGEGAEDGRFVSACQPLTGFARLPFRGAWRRAPLAGQRRQVPSGLPFGRQRERERPGPVFASFLALGRRIDAPFQAVAELRAQVDVVQPERARSPAWRAAPAVAARSFGAAHFVRAARLPDSPHFPRERGYLAQALQRDGEDPRGGRRPADCGTSGPTPGRLSWGPTPGPPAGQPGRRPGRRRSRWARSSGRAGPRRSPRPARRWSRARPRFAPAGTRDHRRTSSSATSTATTTVRPPPRRRTRRRRCRRLCRTRRPALAGPRPPHGVRRFRTPAPDRALVGEQHRQQDGNVAVEVVGVARGVGELAGAVEQAVEVRLVAPAEPVAVVAELALVGIREVAVGGVRPAHAQPSAATSVVDGSTASRAADPRLPRTVRPSRESSSATSRAASNRSSRNSSVAKA